MKRFFNLKWRSIPIGIVSAVLVLVLVAGSAFAVYNFQTFTTTITVEEPLTIEYNFNGTSGMDLSLIHI